MTSQLDNIIPTDNGQVIQASVGGPINVIDPIPELTPPSTILQTFRENPELSLIGENFFRFRCCGGPLARGWAHPCAPTYTTTLPGDATQTTVDLADHFNHGDLGEAFHTNIDGGSTFSIRTDGTAPLLFLEPAGDPFGWGLPVAGPGNPGVPGPWVYMSVNGGEAGTAANYQLHFNDPGGGEEIEIHPAPARVTQGGTLDGNIVTGDGGGATVIVEWDANPAALRMRMAPDSGDVVGLHSIAWTDVHKCDETCWARQSFYSFTTYNMQDVDCVTPTFDLQNEATLQVERNTAWWITNELDSAPLTGNPSMRSFGWDLTPTTGPVSPVQAITILMRAYATQGMGSFLLHVPWYSLPILEAREMIVSRTGGALRTVGGVTVAAGVGYSGVLPNLDGTGTTKPAPPDETLPNQGTIAFYATRSVPEYRLGPVENYPLDPQSRDVRTNHLNAESYRQAAVRFDPGCVYAVAVNIDSGVA